MAIGDRMKKTASIFLIIIILFNLTACTTVSVQKDSIKTSEENREIQTNSKNKSSNNEKCVKNVYGLGLLMIGSAVAGAMIGYRIWPHEDMIMIVSVVGGIGLGIFLGSFFSFCFGFICEPFSSSSNAKEESKK